jgi:hypothetical protein
LNRALLSVVLPLWRGPVMHSALNCVKEYLASSMMLLEIMNSIFYKNIQKWNLVPIFHEHTKMDFT